jgi:hypothetical protein
MEQATTSFAIGSVATGSVKRSARVILTVAAAVSVARGQQSLGPCDPAAFNAKVCKVAIHHKGYCAGGNWVPATYGQAYPYYYDSYQTYLADGGLVTAASAENCHRPAGHFFSAAHGVSRGGFGGTGAGRPAGG